MVKVFMEQGEARLVHKPWGVTTQKDKKIYLHLFKTPEANIILLPGIKEKVSDVSLLGTAGKVKFKQQKEGLIITTDGIEYKRP